MKRRSGNVIKLGDEWWEEKRAPSRAPITILPDEKLYSPKKIAERLDVGLDSIYDYLRSGALRSIRVGRRYRIAGSWVVEFLENESRRRRGAV